MIYYFINNTGELFLRLIKVNDAKVASGVALGVFCSAKVYEVLLL